MTVVPQADLIRVELDPAKTLAAHARHRRRFAQEVSELDDNALKTQSRCTEWTVADILRHLCDVDSWMQAFWTGQPPPFTSFDPNVTPHEHVLKTRDIPDTEMRDRFMASSEAMAKDVENSDPERWGQQSISPVGFVPWWLSALHVFYDSWVHERDCLLPLEITPPVLEDESTFVLTYSLALVGTLGRAELDAVVDGVHLVAGTKPITSTPVETPSSDVGRVIDAINGRDTFDGLVPKLDPDTVKRLGGLARFFGVEA